ncbi:MAG TPA: hypothetical protein VND45_12075, partial [Thermoanaerobaculia bacterium]|nr:hypothetical protein [Thermoanaerobaculia bacterium]
MRLLLGVGIGVAFFAAAICEHHLASRLLFDRWRALRPREWAEAMRATRRMFPFSTIIRSQIVKQRLNA